LLNGELKFRNCPAAGCTSVANTISRDTVTFTANPGLLYNVTLTTLTLGTKIYFARIVIFYVFIFVDCFFTSSFLHSCALLLGCCASTLINIIIIIIITWN
jgi:hypothetical protein